MFRHALCSAVVCGALLAGPNAALAENRLALVIGQSAYRAVTPLPNPANDAKAMSKLLGDAGFDVTAADDLSQKELNERVADFTARIAEKGPDTVALVFYAGHGLQIDGENYLVPVDVDPKREADIPLQAVRLNDVLNTLNAVPSKMRILMLDACRNNPFPAINRTAGHGLAMVDTKTGAPGTFVSFSTSPGAEAEDGDGADSPYTKALLSVVREPGLPIEEAFKRVRVAVNRATNGRQTPWDSSSLTENFNFIIGTGTLAAANAGPKPELTGRSVDEWRQRLKGKPAAFAHEMIVADGTVEAYQAFVDLFVQSAFAAEARAWLERQQRMIAWSNAVTINTATAYRDFLVQYPDSDLAGTARKLIERLRYRPNFSPAVLAANAQATPAALNCPVTPNTSPAKPLKKADLTPPAKTRNADLSPPTRLGPPRLRDPNDDVTVYPVPGPYYGPVRTGRPIGVGIGVGPGGRYADGFGGGYGRSPSGGGRFRRF
jgi:uncharacterized caspase-like protein